MTGRDHDRPTRYCLLTRYCLRLFLARGPGLAPTRADRARPIAPIG